MRRIPLVWIVLWVSSAGVAGETVDFYPLCPGVTVKVLDGDELTSGTLYHGLAVRGSEDLASGGAVSYADFVLYGGSAFPVPNVIAVNADGTVEVSLDGVDVTGFFERSGSGLTFSVASVRIEGDSVGFVFVTPRGLGRVSYRCGCKVLGPLFPGEPAAVPVGPDEALVLLSTEEGPLALLLDEIRGTAVPTELDGVFPSPPTVVWDGKVLVLRDGVPVLAVEQPEGVSVRAVTDRGNVVAFVLGSSGGLEVAAYDLGSGSWLETAYLGEVNGVERFLVRDGDEVLLLSYDPASGEASLVPYEGEVGGLRWETVSLTVLRLRLVDPSFHGGVVVDFEHPSFEVKDLGKVRVFGDGLLEEAELYEVGGGLKVYAAVTGDGRLVVVPASVFVDAVDTSGPTEDVRVSSVDLVARDGTVDVKVAYPLVGSLEMDGCLLVGVGGVPEGDLGALASRFGAKEVVLGLPSEVAFVERDSGYYAVVPCGVSVRLDGEPLECVSLGRGRVGVVVRTSGGLELEVLDVGSGEVVGKGDVLLGGSLITGGGVVAVPSLPFPTRVGLVASGSGSTGGSGSGGPSGASSGGSGGSSGGSGHGLPVVPLVPPVGRVRSFGRSGVSR